MKTTMDSAGRLVIPKGIRAEIGVGAGPVNIEVDGSGIRIEPITGDLLVERDGLWLTPSSSEKITDETVRQMIDDGRM